jgi:hypothetical protein
MVLYSEHLQATFFKGQRVTLVNATSSIGALDLISVNINSVVATYRRVDHMLSLYFNGYLVTQNAAPANDVNEVIDCSTSDNIYFHQFHRYTPYQDTHYHKLAVYDRILTPNEILEMYNDILQ